MVNTANSEVAAIAESQIGAASLIFNQLRPTLFEGLTKAEVNLFIAAAEKRKCRRGALLSTEGEPADQLIMVLSGRARYFTFTKDGRRVLLHSILPGEVFGGMALLHLPAAYLLSTEAIRDGELLVWTRSRIRNLAWRYPRFLENALVTASEYLEWYIQSHLLQVSHSAPQRLAHVVLELAHDIGNPIEEGTELDITNEELADAANITRFSTSRLLRAWQHAGFLTKSRNKVVLRSPDRLFTQSFRRRAGQV